MEGFIRGGSTWAVVEKRSGHVIGAVALGPDPGRAVEGALELGYTLGEQYRDQGYADKDVQRFSFSRSKIID